MTRLQGLSYVICCIQSDTLRDPLHHRRYYNAIVYLANARIYYTQYAQWIIMNADIFPKRDGDGDARYTFAAEENITLQRS